MPPGHEPHPSALKDAALRAIVEGTATATGEAFFAALCQFSPAFDTISNPVPLAVNAEKI